MKKAITTFLVFLSIFCIGSVYATNTNANGEIISEGTKSQLVEIKDKELKSLEDYKESYGSDTYGLVAYVLNKVRIYSIPVAFLGIALSATMLIICQVLPLIFTIVVKGWRG